MLAILRPTILTEMFSGNALSKAPITNSQSFVDCAIRLLASLFYDCAGVAI